MIKMFPAHFENIVNTVHKAILLPYRYRENFLHDCTVFIALRSMWEAFMKIHANYGLGFPFCIVLPSRVSLYMKSIKT